MKRPRLIPPLWFWLLLLMVVAANRIASFSASASIAVMSNVSVFAEEVRSHNLGFLPAWQSFIYPLVAAILIIYTVPLLRYFADGCPRPAPDLVRRRAVSLPLAYAAAGFVAWLFSIPVFVGITFGAFGHWSTSLASQHVFTPIINGYLAATLSYFLADGVCRRYVYPRVFPQGRMAEVEGAFRLGIRGRFFVLLLALSFVPMFVMLGLTRAAEVRLARGLDPAALLRDLTMASEATFAVYVLAGSLLAAIVTRSIAHSLEEAAGALRRVQRGDLSVEVGVDSADEIGELEDGVNEMVRALRDRERILQTFGRVVEPSVRDRLLDGRMEQGGERRRATVLFCDLRGFTSLSEKRGAEDAVETLNEFFTVTTAWVRECGGFVDKFIGDAALVVFGLFDEDAGGEARAAAAAVRCALGLDARLRGLNERRRREGKEALATTNAIHSGEVVAGVIGAVDRHEYTVVGDTVNVAARLQQAAKDHGGTVISGETWSLARDAGMEPPMVRVDSVVLKGRSEPVEVRFLGSE